MMRDALQCISEAIFTVMVGGFCHLVLQVISDVSCQHRSTYDVAVKAPNTRTCTVMNITSSQHFAVQLR